MRAPTAPRPPMSGSNSWATACWGWSIAEKLHRPLSRTTPKACWRSNSTRSRAEKLAPRPRMHAGLADHVILAASEAASGGRRKSAILAGVCEAVIAALYLDGGYRGRARVHRALLGKRLRRRSATTCAMPRRRCRNGRRRRAVPAMRPSTSSWAAKAPITRRASSVEVSVAGRARKSGEGNSKREAEQAAARAMLARRPRHDDETENTAARIRVSSP